MNGHNKWSKIKQKIANTEAEHGKLFSEHSALITTKSRECTSNLNSIGNDCLQDIFIKTDSLTS